VSPNHVEPHWNFLGKEHEAKFLEWKSKQQPPRQNANAANTTVAGAAAANTTTTPIAATAVPPGKTYTHEEVKHAFDEFTRQQKSCYAGIKDKLDPDEYADAKESADKSLRQQLGFMANTREQTAEVLDELVDADLQHVTDGNSYFAQTVNPSCPELENVLKYKHQMLQAVALSNGTATMPVVGLNDIGSDTDLVDHEDARIWNQQGLVVAVIKLPRPKPLTGIGSNYNPLKACILILLIMDSVLNRSFSRLRRPIV